MVLNDERAVIPIGSYQKNFGVTLSLPSVVGRSGVIEVLEPDMSEDEREGLRRSAQALGKALERVRDKPRAKVAVRSCASPRHLRLLGAFYCSRPKRLSSRPTPAKRAES